MRCSISSMALVLLCACGTSDKERQPENAPKPAAAPSPAASAGDEETATPSSEAAAPSTAGDGEAADVGDERAELRQDRNPEIVSDRMMRQLATGAWPLERFIDPERGLVRVTFDTGGGADDARPTKEAEHLCGARLQAAMPDIAETLAVRIDEDLYALGCLDQPPACHSGAVSEYDLTYTYQFVATDRGLMLEGIFAVESVSDAWGEEADRFIARHMKKARARGCPRK